MRRLAIGDIHGCLTALDTLLELVNPRAEDEIITLGDYVDRGPDSRGVLDRLIELQARGNLFALRGNHDEMMLAARDGEEPGMWLACGGKETLRSYGMTRPEPRLSKVPDSHWQFLERDCLDWLEREEHFFVHGTVEPDVPLAEQKIDVLHWEKLYAPVAHCSGKRMVCGHTRQRNGLPLDWGSTLCIDTGAYDPNGWLTCLDVLSGQYWQANQRGHTRTGQLGDS